MPSIIELAFAAPIPRGHEVVVVTFTLDDRSPTVVVDRTANTLFCPEALWGPLHQDPIHAIADPITVLTKRWAWTVKSTVTGICAGAMVSTKGWGDRFEMKTHLLVDATATTGQ